MKLNIFVDFNINFNIDYFFGFGYRECATELDVRTTRP